MIFSHLFRVLNEKEANEKLANVEATNSIMPSSPVPKTRGRANSLQVQQLKNHLATSRPVITEIPPRARVHKQTIQKARKIDEGRSPGFSSVRCSCEEVPLCPASPKVLPPIRSSATSSTEGRFLSDVVSESTNGPKLRKLPPIENDCSKSKRSEKTRWKAFTGNFAFGKGRENDGSLPNAAKLFGSSGHATSNYNNDGALGHRRNSQPAWLHGKGIAEPKTGTLGNPPAIYYHDESKGSIAGARRVYSLATPSQTAREERMEIEEFWQKEAHKKRRKDFLSVKGGKATNSSEEMEPESLQERQSLGLAHGDYYKLNRIDFVPTSTKCTEETQFSCKFSTTQRTNITDTAMEKSSPALEALYANLIVSENRRRNATCEVLEQNEADHGWSLFEKRQVLANSFV